MKSSNDVILVDIYDRERGTAKKYDVHMRPMLHRAFSVFIVDNDRMLLQRRADGKYHSGGLWTNSCCSHPSPGESTLAAAHRRLGEELGMDCTLYESGSFVYYNQFSFQLFEYEYDHIFIGHYRGEVHPAPAEIAETRWVSFDGLAAELLEWPERFSVWFKTSAPIVLHALSAPPQASAVDRSGTT